MRTGAAPGERDLEGGVGFLRGGARPPVEEVIAFIDAHRDRFSGRADRVGCRADRTVLQIAPSTYYAAKKRPPSARAVRDERAERRRSRRVYDENLFVYGADKVWAQLNTRGHPRGALHRRAADARPGLVGAAGGAGRGCVTTDRDDRLDRPADLVDRQFTAPAPNRLWVADLTYVKTHSGWVYVAFIIDVYSRMVVGWQASTVAALRPRDRRAGDGHLEPPTRRRRPRPGSSITATAACNISRSATPNGSPTNDIVASVGSKGDSYDNALAEIVQRALQVGADLPRKAHGAASTTSSSPP